MSASPEAKRVPVARKVVGVRLHARPVAGQSVSAAPHAAKVEWLLSLVAREEQRRAEAAAMRALAGAVQQAMQAVGPAVNARLDDVAALAVELGLVIAREIVGSAIDRGAVDPTPTVVRCLRDCVHGSRADDLVVRLHPEDLALVQQNLAQQPELQTEIAAARFVADRSVARGAVRAETDAGRLCHDPREALERVAAEVRREAAP